MELFRRALFRKNNIVFVFFVGKVSRRLFGRVLRGSFALLEVSWEGRCCKFPVNKIPKRNLSKMYSSERITLLGHFGIPTWLVLADFGSQNENRNSVKGGPKLGPKLY